jgi:DNA helicase HerA-like ATPase
MDQKTLHLGNLEIQNLTQRTISILGGKGSGKTTTMKMLAKVSPVPVVLFDPLNVMKVQGFKRMIVNKATITKGKETAVLLNKFKKENIIIAFHELLQKEQATFLNDLFAHWKPENSLIGIDEVHEVTPESGVSGQYAPEVDRAVRHWRNRNVGFVLSSQRPASVDKNVLALTDLLILYRMTWTHDIEATKKILGNKLSGEEVKSTIAALQTKEFLQGFAVDFIQKS